MSNLIGKIVCGYRILSEVGEGGMGKVYLAESAFLTEYKQQVAIKTLTTFASSERQATILRDLFTREANIQVQFKHPHIVSVIQFAVEGDHYFLILEYMPGYQYRGRRLSNVADVIAHETGPIPHKRALRWFVQALDAMQYAHKFKYRWEGDERIGIVHRDIKPANLLLLDPETIKVSDFGIVKVQQRRGAVTKKLTPGTSAYMAPEAITGAHNFGLSELDARSDIYSLGVTLFQMLAGRLPFVPDPDTNPDLSLRRKHVNEAPPPPSAFYPGIPAQLDKLVMRALEKRPENRYQSAAEFKEAIMAVDQPLGLGLGKMVSKPVFNTNPFSLPTEKIQASTKSAGMAGSAAPEKQIDPAATSIMTAPAQTLPPPAGTTLPGTSKKIWLMGATFALLAALAAGFFIINRGNAHKGQSNLSVDPEKRDMPPPVPAGMAYIPDGDFMMGRNLVQKELELQVEVEGRTIKPFIYDYPAHPVSIRAFYLDKREVSNREYSEFVKDKGRKPPDNWKGQQAPPLNGEELPVTHVTLQDAKEYCAWRTHHRKDGFDYRIPTSEEWEYAARGKDAGKPGGKMNLYPWGDDWVDGWANTKESKLAFPQNVDSNPDGASPYQILNLAGNVYEWTATDFKHYPNGDQKTPREKGYEGTYQVVRGGSFDYPKEFAMTTTRVWAKPTAKGHRLGFRCAASLK
jgi:serine/threonine protein kinase